MNQRTVFVFGLFWLFAVLLPRALYSQEIEFDSLSRVAARPGFKADTGLINRLNSIGIRASSKGTGESFRVFTLVMRLSRQISYRRGEARAYMNMGAALTMANHDARALPYFEKALRLFQQTGDTNGLIHIYTDLGWFYGEIADFKSEISFYKLALAELGKVNAPDDIALIQGNLGTSYEDQKNYRLAAFYYNAMLKTAKKCSDPSLQVWANADLASLNCKMGQYTRALSLTRAGLAALNASKTTDFQARVEIYRLLGYCLMKLNQPADGLLNINRAIDLARQINDLEKLTACLRIRFSIDSIRQDNMQAGRDIAEYAHLHDSLQTVKYNSLVAFYQGKFDLMQKKTENDLLRKKDEQNHALIAALRISLVVLLACFALIIIFFLNLRKKNKQTGRLASLNNQLFAIISHDLRIPFTQVRGLLSLIEIGSLGQNEFQDFIPQLSEQTDTTLNLLDNMLVWSKNQMQGFVPHRVPFSILDLINENLEQFSFRITAKKINIQVEANASLRAFADREMTNIVLRNLLSNALKFSKEHGSVKITASQSQNQELIVCITDTGTGISDDEKTKIFRLSNFTKPGTNNEKGTGMGLKLCKDLLEINHGQIWLESELGKGSTFGFSIPSA